MIRNENLRMLIVAMALCAVAVPTAWAAESSKRTAGGRTDKGKTIEAATVCSDTTLPAPVADDTPIDPAQRRRPKAPSRTDSSSN